jgi:REP element-mobilizing transposase RayT
MARPLRIEASGATYHITSRGNERRDIFQTDDDRQAFLKFLGMAVRRFRWSITAWVLMTNHFHMVIQTPQPNLSRGMQWFLGKYAGWYNARHQRVGHLFQGRFKSILIDKENYFRNVLRYVVLNPVRANLVERPEDYRWSSYRCTAGLDEPFDWFDLRSTLEPFGSVDDPLAMPAYRQFVGDKVGVEDPLWSELVNGIFLGSEEWTKKMRRLVESKPRSTDHPKSHRAVGRPKQHTIISAVAQAARTTREVIHRQRGHPLRELIAWIGWHEGLHTLRSIAASLRLRSEGHISNLIRRCEERFARDAGMLEMLDSSLALVRA